MLIGQIVAVSYASALFFAVREATPVPPSPKKSGVYASNRLVWTTIIATITSFFLYKSVSTPYFLWVLLIVHALLFLPLMESQQCTALEDYDFSVIRNQRLPRCSSALGELLFGVRKRRFGIHFHSYFRASSDEFGWMGRHLQYNHRCNRDRTDSKYRITAWNEFRWDDGWNSLVSPFKR